MFRLRGTLSFTMHLEDRFESVPFVYLFIPFNSTPNFVCMCIPFNSAPNFVVLKVMSLNSSLALFQFKSRRSVRVQC